MKARKVAGCKNRNCPAVYVTDRGTAIAQGTPVGEVAGVTPGPGEVAVELPLDVLLSAVRTLGTQEVVR